MTTPSEEVRQASKAAKRAKWVGIAAAVLTAATPGMYGAWEAAKQAARNRQEEVVRDKQEGDLQKNVRALQVAVEALQKSAVTQRDLVDLVLRLQAAQPPPRRPSSQRGRDAAEARERALKEELARLRKRAEGAAQAAKRAVDAKKQAPTLKPAKQIRKLVQQATGES